MIDLKAVCNALALRYAPGTIATPSGAAAMRAAYGQMPKNIPTVPCVIVIPQSGDTGYGPSRQMTGTHRMDVLFYLSKRTGDEARVETQRQTWLPTLLFATHGKVQLGLSPIVLQALPTGYEFHELAFGGESYDGIVIHVEVDTREMVSLTP